MQELLRVAVGSRNPTKVGAVEALFRRSFGQIEMIALEVPSGVREQPIGQEETLQGARNRAQAALDAAQADFGIGLEGGVVETPEGVFTNGWVVIVDKTGRRSVSQCPWLELPPAVADAVLNGGELGPEMDKLTGQRDTKKSGGAVGFLTRDLFGRQESWLVPVACALAPFLNRELYDKD